MRLCKTLNERARGVYILTLDSNKNLIKWAICIVLPLIIFFLPETALFTSAFKGFLAVTLLGILMLAFELVPNMVSAIIFPVGYAILNIAPLPTVLGSWTSTTPFVVLCGFWLAVILIRIKLLDRVICIIATKFASSFFGIAVTIYLAGVIAAFITFGGHQMLILAFAFGACQAMNLKPGPEATVLMMSALYACIYAQIFSYYPGVLGLLNGAIIAVAPDKVITWMDNLLLGLPMFFVGIIGIFILCKVFGRSIKSADIKETYTLKLQELGVMSSDEKKAIVIVGALFIFLITSKLHGIATDFGIIITPLLFYLPGINIGKQEDVGKINFDMVFLILGCMAIGAAGGYIGLGDILSAYVVPLLGDSSAIGLIAFVFFFCAIFNLLLTPFAIYAAFSAAFAQIAFSMGINPAVIMITMIIAGDTIFLPYEHNSGLMSYAFGMMSMKDFFKASLVRGGIQTIALLAIMIPYWHISGILYL